MAEIAHYPRVVEINRPFIPKICLLFFFSDCVQVIANPGTYVVQARHGSNAPCGVYIAGLHNEIINVEISLVDVTCKTGGLMAVIFFFLKSPEH